MTTTCSLLLEHPHTYTVGRNGDGSNLTIGPKELPALGATLVNVDRGGDITYHGPGQLVGYPIVAVPKREAATTPLAMCVASSRC